MEVGTTGRTKCRTIQKDKLVNKEYIKRIDIIKVVIISEQIQYVKWRLILFLWKHEKNSREDITLPAAVPMSTNRYMLHKRRYKRARIRTSWSWKAMWKTGETGILLPKVKVISLASKIGRTVKTRYVGREMEDTQNTTLTR